MKSFMDLGEIYHFLFETFPGMGCLMGGGLLIALLASVLLERGTSKNLEKRREAKADGWSIFSQDEDEEGEKS